MGLRIINEKTVTWPYSSSRPLWGHTENTHISIILTLCWCKQEYFINLFSTVTVSVSNEQRWLEEEAALLNWHFKLTLILAQVFRCFKHANILITKVTRLSPFLKGHLWLTKFSIYSTVRLRYSQASSWAVQSWPSSFPCPSQGTKLPDAVTWPLRVLPLSVSR